MTSEEIERAFQQVALSIQQLTQTAVRADERQDAAETERRADASWRRKADERLDALINAQLRYEARQEKIEEAFRQVAAAHAALVEMLRLHDERLDGHDEANVHTESRLDALIDSQIRLTERVDTLTGDIAALNGRAAATDDRLDRIGERLDQVAALQAANAEQIKALAEAQMRTDEQIRLLLERNGAANPGRKSTKTAKKKVTKKAKDK